MKQPVKDSRPRLFLHIGLHKTASTSMQAFLQDQAGPLSEVGLAVYDGMIEPGNHIELHVATMRAERMSFSKEKYAISGDRAFVTNVLSRIRTFQAANAGRDLVFTSEALCLLRYTDELTRLAELLNISAYQTKVILVQRNPTAYLRSLRRQIEKIPGRTVSDDPDSHRYVGSDLWLLDIEALVDRWTGDFGADEFSLLDYDNEMRDNGGDVLPGFLTKMGVPEDIARTSAGYHLNRDTFWNRARLWTARVKNAWR